MAAPPPTAPPTPDPQAPLPPLLCPSPGGVLGSGQRVTLPCPLLAPGQKQRPLDSQSLPWREGPSAPPPARGRQVGRPPPPAPTGTAPPLQPGRRPVLCIPCKWAPGEGVQAGSQRGPVPTPEHPDPQPPGGEAGGGELGGTPRAQASERWMHRRTGLSEDGLDPHSHPSCAVAGPPLHRDSPLKSPGGLLPAPPLGTTPALQPPRRPLEVRAPPPRGRRARSLPGCSPGDAEAPPLSRLSPPHQLLTPG